MAKSKKISGYQPTESSLDPSNPPKGGSGVPPKTSIIKVVVIVENEKSANEVVTEE